MNGINWGQGANNNSIGWGQSGDNPIEWGLIYDLSWTPETDLTFGYTFKVTEDLNDRITEDNNYLIRE